MTLYESLHAAPAIAADFVTGLATAIGDDAALSVGEVATALTTPDDAQPVVSVVDATFEDGTVIGAALVAYAAPLTELEDAALGPALSETAHAVAGLSESTADVASVRAGDIATLDHGEGATLSYPILHGTDVVGALVMTLQTESDEDDDALEPTLAASSTGGGTDMVLAEVQMGVTAELGRSIITIRDLLSIAPGSVVDLDRVATAPVDVLVNGTVIARGEVVVIDEEFGVRILEIVAQS